MLVSANNVSKLGKSYGIKEKKRKGESLAKYLIYLTNEYILAKET